MPDLIDRKQISARIADQSYLWEDDYDIDQVLEDIQDAPTIDAIPVEFIEKRAQEYASNPKDSADLFAAGVIQMIVTAWRTERKEE